MASVIANGVQGARNHELKDRHDPVHTLGLKRHRHRFDELQYHLQQHEAIPRKNYLEVNGVAKTAIKLEPKWLEPKWLRTPSPCRHGMPSIVLPSYLLPRLECILPLSSKLKSSTPRTLPDVSFPVLPSFWVLPSGSPSVLRVFLPYLVGIPHPSTPLASTSL